MRSPTTSPFFFPGSVITILDHPSMDGHIYRSRDAEAWVNNANKREILVLRKDSESTCALDNFVYAMGYAINFRIVDGAVLADIKLRETEHVQEYLRAFQEVGVDPSFTIVGYGMLSQLPNREGGPVVIEKFSLSHLSIGLPTDRPQQSPPAAEPNQEINQSFTKAAGESNQRRLHGVVAKGWGQERIVITNDKYCGKFMDFHTGSMFSMHFHAVKDETWYVMSGEFIVRHIDTKTARVHEQRLITGSAWHNPPLLPHQLVCVRAGTILEVSTPDSVEDNYRVAPGDSQDLEKRQ